MFKNMLVSGVKQLVETQLNKPSNQGNQPPQQPAQSNMNYGSGYGSNPPLNQGGNYGAQPYPPQSGGYNQSGFPSGAGPTELNYSAPATTHYGSTPSGYPPQNSYPAQGGSSYPGAQPYPPQNGSYTPQSGFPPQELNYSSTSTPAYPTSSPYPSSTPYPSSGDHSNPVPIGFNVGANPVYPPSGPSYGTAYPSVPSGYPQAPIEYQAPPSAPSYPPQGYQSQYPAGYQPPSAQFGSGFSSGPSGGYGQQQAMWGGTPSVKNYPAFNANTDAESLRKAMKGLGCNNTKVIQVLCARTNGQRQEIARAFKTMYGKDLLADLKSELHGDFEDVILALMERPPVYDAQQLRKAMVGLGTRESVLIEIMTTRTNAQIGELKYVYKQLYGSDLERDLIGETSGHFKRLLVSLCAGGRDESMHVDPVRANHDARKLYQAGEGRLGTDESTFNAILASQNYAQLRLVFDEYHKVCKRPIEQAVQNEFSGDIRDGLLAVCAVVRSKPAYFATLLHNSMKGFGTRDGDLIRAVVTRCEVDMVDIRTAFEGMYKQPLEKMITGDCSGSYKDALIALVRGN